MANLDPIATDIDQAETQEWLGALEDVYDRDGADRVSFIIDQLNSSAGQWSVAKGQGAMLNTPYINTLDVACHPSYPGDEAIEERIEGIQHWNAAVMVSGANKKFEGIGGHIGSYASSCTLYEVGYNHFFKAPNKNHAGDVICFQGHTSPGMYVRSFLSGELSADQLKAFRREVDGKGLPSYPHPWLMPEYWQVATVSMGLGPLSAIYQAKFMRYLEHRGLAKTSDRHVWCFCGDGEMEEPESMGAITRAGREGLGNLTFVINCNLQKLDGLVNSNGKIIQELESSFRGAGWNVIKVIWGESWLRLIEKDTSGLLLKILSEICDGEFQAYRSRGGAYMREKLFGRDPQLAALVAEIGDDELNRLTRGGHDRRQVYAAFKVATANPDQPSVILAKTIKGYGLGDAGESKNTAHNKKQLTVEQFKYLATRFNISVDEMTIEASELYHPGDDSQEVKYLKARREALGGPLPRRISPPCNLKIPHYKVFAARLLGGTTEGRTQSTTTAFVQILTHLCKDPNIGERIVPISPDESRTFGMEGLFRSLGIYNPKGQLYEPEDRSQVMYYREAKDGQVMEEGITEGGAMSSWLAAATSYSIHQTPMIPFYIFYSMFGFQRVGDSCWQAGDMRARGFLLGATAGRTTLNGEGLQHEDGNSHIQASVVPNCHSYDPTYAYEVAVIIHEGMVNMYEKDQDIYYYITLMNENYAHRAMPEDEGVEEAIIKGLYCLEPAKAKKGQARVQLMGSGTILLEVEAAAEMLRKDFDIAVDVWSMTSANQLYREGRDVVRKNRLNPEKTAQVPYVTECLAKAKAPVIAATDYVSLYSNQLREFIPGRFEVLGTDGFGRSDTREKLREHFEVNRYHIAQTALKALVDEGTIEMKVLTDAMKSFKIKANKINPLYA